MLRIGARAAISQTQLAQVGSQIGGGINPVNRIMKAATKSSQYGVQCAGVHARVLRSILNYIGVKH